MANTEVLFRPVVLADLDATPEPPALNPTEETSSAFTARLVAWLDARRPLPSGRGILESEDVRLTSILDLVTPACERSLQPVVFALND